MADGTGLTVAVIPARGGSKSIHRKNLVPLGGRPLLAWSIEVAQQVDAIDAVIVSTDDDEIASVASDYDAEVMMRPAHLATDDALVIDALRDVIARLAAAGRAIHSLVLLEPTCPFRASSDVEECLRKLDDYAIDSVATFAPASVNPLRTWRIDDGRPQTFIPHVNPWAPRQRLPEAFQLNGAVYAFRADRLRPEHSSILFGEVAAVVMPAERSVDIDSPLDLLFASAVLQGAANHGP